MKKYAAYLLLVLLSLILVGCGQKYSKKGVEPDKKEEIVLWSYYETEAQASGLDNLIEEFNKSQTRYSAKWEYVPMTEFTKRLSMAYTENALPDMVLIDNPDIIGCVQQGMLEDITEYAEEWNIETDYYSAMVDSVKYEGRFYGLPFNCNNVALIYNTNMLEEAKVAPPMSWDGLFQAAGLLTTANRKGFLMSAIEGEQGIFQVLPWILSTGEPIDRIGEDGTQKAFAYLYSFIENGSMSRDCINLSQTDVARKFISGEAAMIENGPWVFPMLDEAGIPYDVMPLPVDNKSSVIAGGENLGILKGKNREGAAAFLEFCSQDEPLTKFCLTACVIPSKIQAAKQVVQIDKRLEVFAEQMDSAIVRKSIPQWSTLSAAFSETIYQVMSGEQSSIIALQSLKQKESH